MIIYTILLIPYHMYVTGMANVDRYYSLNLQFYYKRWLHLSKYLLIQF